MINLPNVLVLFYIINGYIVALLLLLTQQDAVTLVATTILLAHVLIWSSYMHHELCHNSVFDRPEWNIRFGRIMDWLNGACYWTFEELKQQHVDHHASKVDFDVTSEILAWIESKTILKLLLLTSEYVYFPLHAYIVHWRSILAPWWNSKRRHARRRTLLILCSRMMFFFVLYYARGLFIIVCYLTAYSVSIQVTRFTDVYSHDYEVVPVNTKKRYLTKSYDMMHTYSIIWETHESTSRIVHRLARIFHVVMFMNFNFHNQHHYATQKKWYELGPSCRNTAVLPKLKNGSFNEALNSYYEEYIEKDTDIKTGSTNMSDDPDSLCNIPRAQYTIPMLVALRAFHNHRIRRIFGKSPPPVLDPETKRISLDDWYGVTDAPILVLEV